MAESEAPEIESRSPLAPLVKSSPQLVGVIITSVNSGNRDTREPCFPPLGAAGFARSSYRWSVIMRRLGTFENVT